MDDKYKVLWDLVWVAVSKLWQLIRDIRSGAIDPDKIDLAALKARIDAIADLPTDDNTVPPDDLPTG